MARTLEQILTDKPPSPPAAGTPETDAPMTGDGNSEGQTSADEAGEGEKPKPPPETSSSPARPPAKGEEAEDDEPPEPPTPDHVEGLRRALDASRGDKRKFRKKWQETERQLAEVQGVLKAYQQQLQTTRQAPPAPPAVQESPKEPTDDDLWSVGPAKYIAQRERAQREQVTGEIERALMDAGKDLQRSLHDDFDDTLKELVAQAGQNQAIARQLDAELASVPPIQRAGVAYNYAKTFAQVQGVGSIEELEARVEARVRAKIAAEQQAAQPPESPATPARPPPKSIAGARGNGVGKPREWKGPRTLKEILG